MSVYGFDEYKNKVLLSDMVPTDVPVPSVLADGSVIYYDRGSNYGQYNLTDGVITRVSDGMDTGTPSTNYWRYLIISPTVYSGIRLSENSFPGVNINMQDGWENDIGYGLQGTNEIFSYTDLTAEQYVFPQIYKKRQTDGYNWFIPAGFEIHALFLAIDNPSEYGINLEDCIISSNISARTVITPRTFANCYYVPSKKFDIEEYYVEVVDPDAEVNGRPASVPLVRRI